MDGGKLHEAAPENRPGRVARRKLHNRLAGMLNLGM
jgi:hypothetical protein